MNLDAGRLVAVNVRTAAGGRARLGDVDYITRFFNDLITKIKMVALRAPEAVVVPPNAGNVEDAHADDGGITVQCIISTSHIAYHSWPLQDRFRIVVDSCKDFSASEVVAMLRDRFPVKEMSVQDMPYKAPAKVVRRQRMRHGPAETQAEA